MHELQSILIQVLGMNIVNSFLYPLVTLVPAS